MKATFTNDPREPLSSVAIHILPQRKGKDDRTLPEQLGICFQPGCLRGDNLPKFVQWDTPGLGVKIFDENGTKIGDGPSDAITDFERHTVVSLLTFDDQTGKLIDHGQRRLRRLQ